jgi:hypothetical protein
LIKTDDIRARLRKLSHLVPKDNMKPFNPRLPNTQMITSWFDSTSRCGTCSKRHVQASEQEACHADQVDNRSGNSRHYFWRCLAIHGEG